jgi:uncharacterized membrane protein YgcG
MDVLQVINMAFELLLGGSGESPGRPVSAVVLLMRALWEYLHCHGLGSLLAKPLKMMLALRSTLLVRLVQHRTAQSAARYCSAQRVQCLPMLLTGWILSAAAGGAAKQYPLRLQGHWVVDLWCGCVWMLQVSAVPLWVRRSVMDQLVTWEQGLLWQHAATPLDVTGNVGLVHLLRTMQELQQICLHHWDEPHLAQLLRTAAAEEQGQPLPETTAGAGSSSYSKQAPWQLQQQHPPDAGCGSSAASGGGAVGGGGGGGGNDGASGSDSSSTAAPAVSGAAAWSVELPSLLQLRLLLLEDVGQQCAYLELAMAGGAWKQAIDRMLKSKERWVGSATCTAARRCTFTASPTATGPFITGWAVQSTDSALGVLHFTWCICQHHVDTAAPGRHTGCLLVTVLRGPGACCSN